MTNVDHDLAALPPPVRTRTSPRALLDSPASVTLKPLRIGPLVLGLPVVQAALSGYSDWPMRIVARRLGAPFTMAEVMIDRMVRELRAAKSVRQWFRLTDEEHPVGGQLMGSAPDGFDAAARRMVEAGFDLIDINFGCPVKSAVGGCRGGYHLSQPGVALEIVSRVREAVPATIPVTLKMRRGIDDSEHSRKQFFTILDGAFERGVAAVTVHGRTVEQRYDGPSNWDFLLDVKQHAGERTIIGSGDLFTAQACLEMLAHTGVDGCWVARGAIGNPWIFRQVEDLAARRPEFQPSLVEQHRTLAMQLALCLEIYDERQACAVMRKFAVKFARRHPEHALVRNDFGAARTLCDWQQVLTRHYPG